MPDTNQKLSLNKLLAREVEFFSANKGLKKKLIRYHKKEMTYGMYGWKNYAYHCFFDRKDAKAFRRYIKEAASLNIFVLNPKVIVYYILSLFSVDICKKIKGLRRNIVNEKWQDDICDVKEMDLY